MSRYTRLVHYLKPHLGVLGLAICCMAAATFFSGVSLGMIIPLADKVFTDHRITLSNRLPYWLDGIVDWVNDAPRLQLLTLFALTIPFLFFLKGLVEFWQNYLMNDVSQRVIRDLRGQLFTKFTTLSLDYFGPRDTGSIASRIIYDVSVIQNSITEGLADFVFQSLQVVLFSTIIFWIDWKLALVAILIVPFMALPIVRVGRALRKLSINVQQTMGQINSTIYEALSGIHVVQAFGMEAHERSRFARQNQTFYRLNMQTVRQMNMLAPLTEFCGAVGGAFVFWYAGQHVIHGVQSLGTFLFFLGATMSLVRPFKRLSRLHSINQQAMGAAERIFEVLDEQPTVREAADAADLPTLRETIRFDEVEFQYVDQPVLRGIHLDVQKGDVVAFVGPSGVGKTTLVNLLPRFYDPTRGRVLIDDVDIRQVTLSSLRRQIAVVTQETVLFNDTVRWNIAYGKPDATEEEIERAARAANAHDFILRLPQGYDTVIGQRGELLSGGERQRLAIARALLKDPPILILDEATSHLDSESERLVSAAIERLMEGRTVFMIAHRFSTIRHAARIVVLDEGRIVEIGPHEDLLERSPLYRRFYELQVAV